jgi:glutamyl-tRNA synthetase
MAAASCCVSTTRTRNAPSPNTPRRSRRTCAGSASTGDEFARQTDRLPAYAAAAERLKASGRLYPCLETEEELAYKREQRIRQGRPPVYDRAALKMTKEQLDRAIANGKQPHWRFLLSPTTVEWNDGVLGRRSVKLPSLSDPVLIRADGSFLYTFTSVVDDLELGITDVVRGEDHVTNTGIQLDILAALAGGYPRQIRFAHLPLLTDADGGPLSKRTGSVGLRQMRRDGVEPRRWSVTSPRSAPPSIRCRGRRPSSRGTTSSPASASRLRASTRSSSSR